MAMELLVSPKHPIRRLSSFSQRAQRAQLHEVPVIVHDFDEAETLEGFLFPATYSFEPGVDATTVITTMVDRTYQSLDAAGVPLYAITNFSGEFFPPFRAKHAALFDRFRDIVVSGDERLVKPDPAIYRLALARFGLAADAARPIERSYAWDRADAPTAIVERLTRSHGTMRATTVKMRISARPAAVVGSVEREHRT